MHGDDACALIHHMSQVIRVLQDYRVHIKHTDGHFEYIPYFSLPANDLNDVIADSCYSCFDYPNALADLVIGYMGVPWQNVNMTQHQQVVTVRSLCCASAAAVPLPRVRLM